MNSNTRDLTLQDRIEAVHKRLIEYFGHPEAKDPLPILDELILTILSQNTNDTNRDRAYNSLRKRFSTWEAVRDANLPDVVTAIKSAGLANIKGARIQDLLREITAQRGGLDVNFLHQLPPGEVRKWLSQFKGVGPKTIAIVMLFSMGLPAFPVDTHIYRVSGRLGLRSNNITPEQAHHFLASHLPPKTYFSAHLNIIRLGREYCHARKPNCRQCPLQNLCLYYQENPNR